MIWFTADYHLSHANIIEYCQRPFQSIDEMDAIIIQNLKDKVKPNDVLYFLGDLTFDPSIAVKFFQLFKDLQIHFIVGNHDSKEVVEIAENHCVSISRLRDITLEGQAITLCHYAMRVWNKSHYNSWQLHGHSHAKLSPVGKQYDVGVDNNKFYPISFEELIEVMKEKPNNFNYLQSITKHNGGV